jgi:hypothetical protein
VTGNTLTLKANRVRYPVYYFNDWQGRLAFRSRLDAMKTFWPPWPPDDRAAGQTCRRREKMTSNTLNAVPATVLETMAERLQRPA